MKYLTILLLSCTLFSCQRSLYQVQKMSAENVKSDINGNYYYEDSILVLQYNFWSKGGSLTFTIVNKTDSAFFIDMKKSNLVFKGYRYNYMNGKRNLGSNPELEPKATYLKNDNGKGTSMVKILPKTGVTFYLFNLNCPTTLNFKTKYNKNQDNQELFTKEDSPLRFRNTVAILFNPEEEESSPYLITNSFWESGIMVYDASSFKNINTVMHNSFFTAKRVLNLKGAVIIASISIPVLLYEIQNVGSVYFH